jgi:hypothetical protein
MTWEEGESQVKNIERLRSLLKLDNVTFATSSDVRVSG